VLSSRFNRCSTAVAQPLHNRCTLQIKKDAGELASHDLGSNLNQLKLFNARRKFKSAISTVILANQLRRFAEGITSPSTNTAAAAGAATGSSSGNFAETEPKTEPNTAAGAAGSGTDAAQATGAIAAAIELTAAANDPPPPPQM
jgi:hypothetical protein